MDDFSVGEELVITDGPMAGYAGRVVAVDAGSRQVTVRTLVFERPVDVTLRPDQLSRPDRS